ncbi:preprotein translocase subunit SecY [Candidatus Falkowbacteria bacterium RIFOXYB2_FULL_34_18]|uniref:Protein translocase subunit SecY n=1 Tax=Candidatus Falkowbacteria bacterium RIFOXYD2_FULL_34_120 TaxID=1798007 RepID=A0A1F5TSW4_9BACT|nr:MAG: preprotein translocase subunit SecY [Candidatus Falkowbacteria bacterium RIFOXYB2_FULL_34_18]OGF30053.1 MAG: preprotein translocase subunit SecY [Candidatus Falkowbacteria bacterium RIFOXYC12_FULL_34_55]OGF37614.1 MAG: preprotein translocase subunit SecY [Candidatus Falkowbacteria bacterium RIFOXYC2_FULL_34_220]OGF39369.1 MAG: preprotein translocase subunit SecY [Candidatus Falkowbacteria bacterium RIFOXYD12_FULL_34_57]OGF41874.1 MAG: preprotein translocase subunit SecY [Candidatus Falk
MVFDKLIQIWKAKDLRKNILFVLAMLVIFRIAAHIPIPGVNPEALRSFFDNNQILGLLNVFSGGSMQNFSIVMMGIAPYITASIIFQLLGMIIPKLEEMQKEESGRQKINMWTRWLTVPMAAMQSFGMITILRRGSADILGNISQIELLSMIVIITAGTIFLMWIGELITEKKIGNGISLLIFAGIISGLPQAVQQAIVQFDAGNLFVLVGFVVIALLTIVGVVYITEGQRNIPVQYAKQIRGNRIYGGTSTHLPLRVNMAGVIPIIFAISVVLFPSMIAQFFIHAKTQWIQTLAEWVMTLFQNQLFYGVLYFILVFAFTYFYTEVIFHPNQIAENLQKQGGFIPGIRPGKNTAEYLANTTHKIIFVGALFLGIIAILPLIMKYFTGMQSLAIGGTSLLIVVAVVVETVKQIESQLTMREYEGM